MLLNYRKVRLTQLVKIERKTADQIATTIIRLLRPHAHKVHFLASNNGKNCPVKDSAEHLDVDFSFALPYALWECETNENMNRQVRQFFPNCMTFARTRRMKFRTLWAE